MPLAAGVVIVAGATLGMVRYLNGSPPERDAAGVLAAAAFAGPFVATGVLGLAGRHDRPWLLTAAGTALVPLSFVSFAGVTFPLVIPAGVFLVYGAKGRSRWRPAGVAVALASATGIVAALALLFVHQDPANWQTATSSGSTSDIVTTRESSLSLAVVALVLALAPRVGGQDRSATTRR